MQGYQWNTNALDPKGSLMIWFHPKSLCVGFGGQLLVFIPALLLLRSATGTPADCWPALTGRTDAPPCAVDPFTPATPKSSHNLDSVWLSPSGEMLAVTSPGGTVRRTAFSPDGSLLATAMDRDRDDSDTSRSEHGDPMLHVSAAATQNPPPD
jgi:hypothetical protein